MNFEKVVAYCKTKIPGYEYSMMDFMIYEEIDKNDKKYFVIKNWDLHIAKPTENDLNLITTEEEEAVREDTKELDTNYKLMKQIKLLEKRILNLELK